MVDDYIYGDIVRICDSGRDRDRYKDKMIEIEKRGYILTALKYVKIRLGLEVSNYIKMSSELGYLKMVSDVESHKEGIKKDLTKYIKTIRLKIKEGREGYKLEVRGKVKRQAERESNKGLLGKGYNEGNVTEDMDSIFEHVLNEDYTKGILGLVINDRYELEVDETKVNKIKMYLKSYLNEVDTEGGVEELEKLRKILNRHHKKYQKTVEGEILNVIENQIYDKRKKESVKGYKLGVTKGRLMLRWIDSEGVDQKVLVVNSCLGGLMRDILIVSGCRKGNQMIKECQVKKGKSIV